MSRPLIALDLDGTIEDSRDDMVASVARVRADLGLPTRPSELVRPWVNRGMPVLYARCFDDFDDQTDRVQALYETDYARHIAVSTVAYSGVPEALQALAARGLLACVTNKPEALSRRLLEALDLAHHFATVVGGDSCAQNKPDPIMLAEALARTGTAGPVVMIGDSAGDVRLAQAFGCPVVWCAWGYAPLPVGLEPDAVVEHARELPSAVSRLFG